MGYGLPAAMAARLAMPDCPVLCTMGDGGFSMVFADLETCVRRRIHFITVVYNDNAREIILAVSGCEHTREAVPQGKTGIPGYDDDINCRMHR